MEYEKMIGTETSIDLWGFLKAINFRGDIPKFLGALVGIELLSIALKASTCAVFDGNVHVWETDDSELVWSDWGTCLFFLLFFIFQTKGHSTNYSSVYKNKDGKKFLVAQCASLLCTTFGVFTLFKYVFDIANFNFGRPLLTQSGQECHVLQLSTLFSNIVSLGSYLAIMFTF